ncbi:unnamed protein product [Albugo candida]|uniref:Uncharacterized protein n=1 Tax=Albugo candida TaxID=65357 RepID=A0A024GCB6_9STRA|nr:unnamed protein product [Albugo candida]|eukprot:CCI44494.1 unnamed protein product [Albugo candida]
MDLVYSVWHSRPVILLFHESFCREFRISQSMDTVCLSFCRRVWVACCSGIDPLSIRTNWFRRRYYDQTTCESTTFTHCHKSYSTQFLHSDFSTFSIFHNEFYHSFIAGGTDGHFIPTSYQICSLKLEDGRYSVLTCICSWQLIDINFSYL